jgi:hypothetical protein
MVVAAEEEALVWEERGLCSLGTEISEQAGVSMRGIFSPVLVYCIPDNVYLTCCV